MGKLSFSTIVLALISAIYWFGVFGGYFPHKFWLNSDPDTWIHGGLSTIALIAVIGDLIGLLRPSTVGK